MRAQRRPKLRSLARAIFVFGGTFAAAAYWNVLSDTLDAGSSYQVSSNSAVTPPSPAPEAAPAPPPPAVQPQQLDGLSLYGVRSGRGGAGTAILGFAPEAQRAIRVGSDYRPGLRLVAVGTDHAVVATGGTETRLELARAHRAGSSAASRAPSPGAARPPSPSAIDRNAKMGMVPRKAENGRTDGFAVRDPREVPALQRAGVREGDVIVAVNGQAFDSQEKLLDLPREIAGSYTAEFEIERNGRRVKVSLPVNSRTNP